MGRSVSLVTFCAAAVAVLGVTTAALAATPIPKAMVLRLSDLPTSFAVTDIGVLTNEQEAKQKGQLVSLYTKLGRVTGYEIGFKRNASPGSLPVGALVVVSSASMYTTTKGASTALRVESANIEANAKKDGTKLRRLSIGSPIGQEARLYREESTESGLAEVTYVVVWRQGPILSYVVTWAPVAVWRLPERLPWRGSSRRESFALSTRGLM
jgi:hypothetical protein